MSPRTGRPKADKPKVIRYSIRLDEQTGKQKLQNYCNKNSITKAEAIRRGIQMLLSETKKKQTVSHKRHKSVSSTRRISDKSIISDFFWNFNRNFRRNF